jgi:hypothetical protein
MSVFRKLDIVKVVTKNLRNLRNLWFFQGTHLCKFVLNLPKYPCPIFKERLW